MRGSFKASRVQASGLLLNGLVFGVFRVYRGSTMLQSCLDFGISGLGIACRVQGLGVLSKVLCMTVYIPGPGMTYLLKDLYKEITIRSLKKVGSSGSR